MSPVETLHAAATRLREMANACEHGLVTPWEDKRRPNRRDRKRFLAMAEGSALPAYRVDAAAVTLIATMADPGMARLTAHFLDDLADHWTLIADQAEDPDDPTDEDGWRITDTIDGTYALTVAHRVLGEEA